MEQGFTGKRSISVTGIMGNDSLDKEKVTVQPNNS